MNEWAQRRLWLWLLPQIEKYGCLESAVTWYWLVQSCVMSSSKKPETRLKAELLDISSTFNANLNWLHLVYSNICWEPSWHRVWLPHPFHLVVSSSVRICLGSKPTSAPYPLSNGGKASVERMGYWLQRQMGRECLISTLICPGRWESEQKKSRRWRHLIWWRIRINVNRIDSGLVGARLKGKTLGGSAQ